MSDMNATRRNMIPDIDVFGQMKKERNEAVARNVVLSWKLEMAERNVERLTIENRTLKDAKPIKQNNSLVTDDTAAIVEAYEHLAMAYSTAETLAKLYRGIEVGKPVDLTATEIANKIRRAVTLLKNKE